MHRGPQDTTSVRSVRHETGRPIPPTTVCRNLLARTDRNDDRLIDTLGERTKVFLILEVERAFIPISKVDRFAGFLITKLYCDRSPLFNRGRNLLIQLDAIQI